MLKRISFYILSLLAVLPCFAANDIVRVSATYEYISDNPRETPEQAEKSAFDRAKQKALEDKFGVDVASVTNTFVVNSAKQSQNNTFALGGTSVRGEWLETLKEQVLDKQFTNGFWVVKVKVEGRARNYAAEKADIQFTPVKDIQDLESPVTFRDGNDIFLRFSSPVAGHLCVYLVDEAQNAYCLLPYMTQQTGSQPIEANKEYVFFSSKFDRSAQEYTLTCERTSEQNALYVVFSPNDFIKAADKQGGKNFRDEQLPRELSYEAFLKWLTRIQTKDPQLVVRPTVLSIRK
ncbi:MAG: DUF4384 domain-containing protein [Paludibacteraceae bacterium]|nr:DUF4384 domain-containing protein [Paludibacteraceae bacterium]